MGARSRFRSNLHGLAAALLLLAVAVRAATPMGWMPNPDAGAGGPAFVICGAGHGVPGQDAPGHEPSRAHEVCAFAGVHAAPAAPSPAVPEPVRYATFAEARPVAPVAIHPAPIRTPQAARAPPISV